MKRRAAQISALLLTLGAYFLRLRQTGAAPPGWADDERSFFISNNERDNRFFDVYEVSVEPGYERALVFRDTTGYQFAAISPDERFIAFVKPRTTTDSDISIITATRFGAFRLPR